MGSLQSYLEETLFYNENGQIVQHHSTNQLFGFDKILNKFSFTGMLLKTKHSQSTATQTEITEITSNEYDHANRLKKVKYQIGGYPEIILSEIKYDELDRIIEKKRHDMTDIELFSYNIRNWLKQKTSGTFNEFLYYNGDVPVQGLDAYNGNIALSGIKSGPVTKSYAYSYDQLNRLTNGKGYYRTSGAYSPYGYDESFGYDKNGNVNYLQRKNSSTIIDYLSYIYNGNQISNVFDYTGSQNSYAIKEYNNNNTQSDIEFKYDPNGNMIVDKDRKIVAIKYNLLNLPDTIQFSNGNQIVNRYAADGRKLGTEFFTQLAALAQPLVEGQVKKQQYSFGLVDQSGIMYTGNFEYKTQNGSASLTSLNKVFNQEGYVDEFANNTSYSGFCYYRTDHLGNVCEVWRAAKPGGALATTLQKTFYFPSGLPLSYSTSPGLQPYKYNNKPFIEMHGFDSYDYSARMMYPSIGGRFMTVDPLAEDDPEYSTYVYCRNNPVNNIDPDGRWVLNLVSALGNAALDYGSQVAVNMASGSSFKEAITKDISVGSILMSGVAGALNPIGETTKNLGKTTLKTIVRTTLNEGVNSASGQVIDNVIKGDDLLKNVGSEFIVGGAMGNLKIKSNHNNSNVTIDKINKKLDKGKTLTSGQQKQLNSAIIQKKANIATEVIINTSVKTSTNIVKNGEKN